MSIQEKFLVCLCPIDTEYMCTARAERPDYNKSPKCNSAVNPQCDHRLPGHIGPAEGRPAWCGWWGSNMGVILYSFNLST